VWGRWGGGGGVGEEGEDRIEEAGGGLDHRVVPDVGEAHGGGRRAGGDEGVDHGGDGDGVIEPPDHVHG
jgi:hypothetical protein